MRIYAKAIVYDGGEGVGAATSDDVIEIARGTTVSVDHATNGNISYRYDNRVGGPCDKWQHFLQIWQLNMPDFHWILYRLKLTSFDATKRLIKMYQNEFLMYL